MGANRPPDTPELRKARGAFFTPPAIADALADWAIGGDPGAKILDPTCGEAVFLLSAARKLRELETPTDALARQVYGVDLHQPSLDESKRLLQSEGLDARLIAADFFGLPTPSQLGCPLPEMDAVIGNPPFVRYQQHVGETRQRAMAAALEQGVRLNKLASSWAALLVHACAFLKPEGRLAMVLPAELLTVHYAEPIRRWLRQRFARVYLVLFGRLQFADAQEKVVLVVAQGSGGCDGFSLYEVEDAEDLGTMPRFNHLTVVPEDEGKWTDLLLPLKRRQLFKRVNSEHFVTLGTYGSPTLGTVTGANDYFALSERTRLEYGLSEDQLVRISPPGTRHLRGLAFTTRDWERLRDAGEAVWLLYPSVEDESEALRNYLKLGEELGVPDAYKCRKRTPWWRPPVVPAPDFFFTYMSHRYPKLVRNSARTSFLNSMHGLSLRDDAPRTALSALPLLGLNSVTMLGAEVHGRSYGGGVLKMEPREAANLPMPGPEALAATWERLGPERVSLDRQLRSGRWTAVVKRVDEVLLRGVLQLTPHEAQELHEAARSLRERRIGREIELAGGG